MFNDEKIIKRIKDTKIFRNVIYIDVGKYKKPYIISAYIDFKKNSYVPKEGYKKVISFNIEGVIQTVLFNMNKTRKMTMMAMLCAIALVAVAVCKRYKIYL